MAVDVEALYKKYGPMVLRRCRSLLGDGEQAMDAAQETFVKLIRYSHKLNDRAPSSLLYCMATNTCLNILRTERRRPRGVGDSMLESIASAEDVEGRAVDSQLLESIFGGERPSTRTIAVLHYVDGMTLEEVAGHVGMSVSGVRKRLRQLSAHSRIMEEA